MRGLRARAGRPAASADPHGLTAPSQRVGARPAKWRRPARRRPARKVFPGIPSVSKLFQGFPSFFQAFSKDFQIFSLAVLKEIKGL
jgi:hypothetical protein